MTARAKRSTRRHPKREYDASSELQFDVTEAQDVFDRLSLKSVELDDYLLIIRSVIDVTIGEEPYLALMLLLDTDTGRFFARVWNRTILTGRVFRKEEFLEICSELFGRGMPCMGYPDEERDETAEGLLTSHIPYPRKISRLCNDLLGKGASTDVLTCKECLKLGEPKELKVEIQEDFDETKDPSEEIAVAHFEDYNEDEGEASLGKVVKHESHEFNYVIGDEFKTENEEDNFKEDTEEYKFDANQVVHGEDKEKADEECRNRDSSDDDDDDYVPPNDDSGGLDSEDGRSPKQNPLKPKESRGRPPKPITDPKLCSETRQRKVKQLRITFKGWCSQLGCEVNQLSGLLLYLNNICAKCSKQELAKRSNVCTEGASPELAKIGWEITHSKLCSGMLRQKVEEMRATFQGWCTKLGCTTDQLNGLFLHLNNYRKKQKLALVGRKIFKGESLHAAEDDNGTKVIERVAFSDNKQKLEGEPKFICTICGKKLMTRRNLLAHEREHGGTMDTCDICGQRFTMFNALANHKAQKHRKISDPQEVHCCDKCGKQYGSKASLDTHIKNVHGEPVKCEHCEFSTSNRQVLVRHQGTHGDPKYKCSICGKLFREAIQ